MCIIRAGSGVLVHIFSDEYMAAVAKHLLAFFLIVLVPVREHFQTKRLKASTDPRAKVKAYQQAVCWLWLASGIACVLLGVRTVLTIHRSAGEASWLPDAAFVIGCAGAILLALFVPVLIMMRSPTARARVTKSAEKLRFILPFTREERRWFVPVAITAGVCEEILYRGFLIHYFGGLPFHFGLMATLVVSAGIFGFAHLYQGIVGIIQTAILGAIFGVIFVATGNLLVPMIMHALIDLRILLILKDAGEPLIPNANAQ